MIPIYLMVSIFGIALFSYRILGLNADIEGLESSLYRYRDRRTTSLRIQQALEKLELIKTKYILALTVAFTVHLLTWKSIMI